MRAGPGTRAWRTGKGSDVREANRGAAQVGPGPAAAIARGMGGRYPGLSRGQGREGEEERVLGRCLWERAGRRGPR